MTIQMFERGSEWRKWDLHIHTPASFHWDGERFPVNDTVRKNEIIDELIKALNEAEPSVFAIMDYWTFDGWLALRKRLGENGAPRLNKTVFPGIELRLVSPTKYRLNAHVIFSDGISDQALIDFKSSLIVEASGQKLSDNALKELARSVGDDFLKKVGESKEKVDVDESAALIAGSKIAEINCDSYKRAIKEVPGEQAIGFMPYDTSDGLGDVKWHEHYAYFIGLFKSSPIFESRNPDLRGAFVNEVTEGNAKWIKSFQSGLDNVPRLVVSGSDAHRFRGVKGDNNKRGYGDFPSGKVTWIKADPTFKGLLQAIKEPAKRSFIGERPHKHVVIEENKTFFINEIKIDKISNSDKKESWLDKCSLKINTDLVAIIGKKGSGKSALADVIALLGNSKQKAHFSFLIKDRFRGKLGEPAKHFEGTLTWLSGGKEVRNLNEDPPTDKVDLVRYIPQGHFENLCNEHISGSSNAFENELRSVIFSHAGEAITLGAHDFDQLIERQERGFRDRLGEYRKELHKINIEIVSTEERMRPSVRSSLIQLRELRQLQIAAHEEARPPQLNNPQAELTPEQTDISREIERIANEIKELDLRSVGLNADISLLSKKTNAAQALNERVVLLERVFKQFEGDVAINAGILGIQSSEIASLSTNRKMLEDVVSRALRDQGGLREKLAQEVKRREELKRGHDLLSEKLNEPQLQYQRSVNAMEKWNLKRIELIGSEDEPETLRGIEAQLAQLDLLPSLLDERRAQRLKISGDIFDALDSQRISREELFRPVQELIQGNSLIREEYKLQFQAALHGSPDGIADSLFELIKQSSGEFRGGGGDEGIVVVRKLVERFDFNTREGVLGFVNELAGKISRAASGDPSVIGIASILRKGKTASEVYDLLYGLPYLATRYSLLFQDTHIEHLSPGQRGALLLIFYLLVDKGHNPIILDQPEENLDNETVVSLLVPVLTQAKQRRQILMVTHNPNLAVVCDAEQIIYSFFDRKNQSKISYIAGAIEDPVINSHVVNVLEGTSPAFNNRRGKYHLNV